METKTKTYWVSKWALTKGVQEIRVDPCEVRDGRVRHLGFGMVWPERYNIGTEAHETRDSAIEAAEKMRIKKIASLEKQIAKLKGLKFE